MRTGILAALLLLALAAGPARAQRDCTAIADDTARLRCYDAARGRPLSIDTNNGASLWEQRILHDADEEPFTLRSYKPSYIMYTRLDQSNPASYRSLEPGNPLQEDEVKFQLSLQTKIAEDLFDGDGDLWFAYTQTAYWQISNDDISFPFRETNHEPQAHLSFVTDYPLLGFSARRLNLGIVHQSNGQARPLSRTWNRLFAEFHFVRGPYLVQFKPWVWIKDNQSPQDNQDIDEYFGYYELRTSYARKRHLYALMLRNVFDRDGRYNAEINWSFPISGRLRGLAQIYSGYGENLIDYDHEQNRIGIGVLLSDWL